MKNEEYKNYLLMNLQKLQKDMKVIMREFMRCVKKIIQKFLKN